MPIVLASKKTPVVEIDTKNRSAYVRFGNRRVSRTDPLPQRKGRGIATIDFDAENLVIGIKFIGVNEFTIEKLLKGISLGIPESRLKRARYVALKS